LGGGSIVNKTPEKVDCSAAFGARYVAKNIVAAGLAEKCLLQVAYAIGYPEPVSLMVNTYGTGKLADDKITDIAARLFSFKPAAIIKQLDLLRPIYSKTTNYGHFGKNDPEITWEKTDKVEVLRKAAGGKKPGASVVGMQVWSCTASSVLEPTFCNVYLSLRLSPSGSISICTVTPCL
jgi:S-adenosylmethionine synthetase